MRCEDAQGQLNAFTAGELPAEAHEVVRAHLAECSACRATLAKIDPLAGAIAGAQEPPVPEALASRIMAAAREREEARPLAAWNLARWWRATSFPMHAAAAAVLIIGLSIGIAMGWTSRREQPRTTMEPDPVDAYQIDYLGEAPAGSLADSYLTLVSATDEGGR